MKGVVFTELIEMVEDRLGPACAEQMIEQADLPNGGAYTAVGTYDHREILRMVQELSAITGAQGRELVRGFGEHLFGRFAISYKAMIARSQSTLDFLAGIETYIHKEVRKLYPEAELPRFECNFLSPVCLELVYHSQRPFADLAEGLIQGCARHFGEQIAVDRQDLPAPAGNKVRFILTKMPA